MGRFVAPNISQTNILHVLRVKRRSLNDLLQQRIYYKIQRRILEASFERFGQGRPKGKGYNNIVRILLRAMNALSVTIHGFHNQKVVLTWPQARSCWAQDVAELNSAFQSPS